MGGGSAIAKGDDDCACTGVEISMKMYPDPNVDPGTVFLPTVSHFSDITGKAIRYPTDIKDDQIDLVVKSLWEKKFTTEYVGDTSTVFTLMAGAELMSSGEVNLGLRGYLDGGYPKNWNLVFMVNTPKWDWTTLTHELGHYVGIGGHWNGNEHPYRIIASEPHKMRSINRWNPYWFKPAVTMTKEECAYWRGAWDRLSYDTRFFPEGRDDEHFSYYSESGKAYWDEWINKDDYPYLERPGSTGSP